MIATACVIALRLGSYSSTFRLYIYLGIELTVMAV